MQSRLYELLDEYQQLKSRYYKLLLKRNNIKLWVGEETMGTAIILSIIGMGLWLWPVFFLRFLIVGVPKLILHIKLKRTESKAQKKANEIDLQLKSIKNEKEIDASEIINSLSKKCSLSSINNIAQKISDMVELWLKNSSEINEFNLVVNKNNIKFLFFGKAIEGCPDEIVLSYSKFDLPFITELKDCFALGTMIIKALSNLTSHHVVLYAKYQDLYFSKQIKNDRTTFLHRYSPYEYDGFYDLNEELFIVKLAYYLMCLDIKCDKHDIVVDNAEFNIKLADLKLEAI